MGDKSYINFSQLRVIGSLKLEELIDVTIHREINQHTRATIVGIINEDVKDTYIQQVTQEDEIGLVYYTSEGKENRLFCGAVSRIEVHGIQGVFYASIEAISGSHLMDVVRKSRSFPREATCTDILKAIKADYHKGDFIEILPENPPLDRLLVQYEESDFEFVNRLASQLGAVVIPEDLFNRPRFFFGIPQRDEIVLTEDGYGLNKNFSAYLESRFNYNKQASESAFTCFQFTSGEVLKLGDSVRFNGYKRVVTRIHTQVIGGQLSHTYSLTPVAGLGQRKGKNVKIKGCSLTGQVKDVQGTKVRVQLDIDEDREIQNWYSYITESSNGLYSMPLVGDTVQIYFPSDDDEEAFARGSYPKSTANLNPDIRYWANPQGRRIEFSPGGLEFKVINDTINNRKIVINLNDSLGIKVVSHKPILIGGDGAVHLKARSISIQAKEAVNLMAWPKARQGVVPLLAKGIMLTPTDISIKGRDHFFSGYERLSFPFEEEPRPAFCTAVRENPERKSRLKKMLVGVGIALVVVAAAAVIVLGVGPALLALGKVALAAVPVIAKAAPLLAKGSALLGKMLPVIKATGHFLIGGLIIAGVLGREHESQEETDEALALEEIKDEGNYQVMLTYSTNPLLKYNSFDCIPSMAMYADALMAESKGKDYILQEVCRAILPNNLALMKPALEKEDKGLQAGVVYLWDRTKALGHGGLNMIKNNVKAIPDVVKTSLYGWGMLINAAVAPFDQEQFEQNMIYLADQTKGFRQGIDYTIDNFWDKEKNPITAPFYYLIQNGEVYLDPNTPYDELVAYNEKAYQTALMMMGMEKFSNSIKISPNGLKVMEALTPEGVIVTNLIYDANAVTISYGQATQGMALMAAANGGNDGGNGSGSQEDGESEATKEEIEGSGKIVFKSDFADHLRNVQSFNRDASKGITGGHNMNEFYNYFRNVEKLDDVDLIHKVTKHPTIDGIIQIEYKIPKLDNKGNLTGEYKYFKNPKTVYDPLKISDETIIEWGKAAMQQGMDAGSIVGRKITGVAPNGLKFEGYMDSDGIITNFYPKID